MTEALSSEPRHQEWPHRWELRDGPTAALLEDYLRWVIDNPDVFESATQSMDTYGPGFRGLVIAINRDPNTGVVQESIQINLYQEDFPGDNGPHGHSRDAVSALFMPPDAEQFITRHQALPKKVSRALMEELGGDIQERIAVAMCIGDRGDGRQPDYNPVKLGEQLVVVSSEIGIGRGSVRFRSREVHHVGFKGDGVGVSVHYKGPEESPFLNTAEGFVALKNLPPEWAEELVLVRRRMIQSGQIGEKALRLAPSTMIYPEADRVDALMTRAEIPRPTPQAAEDLLLGALHTAELLRKIS